MRVSNNAWMIKVFISFDQPIYFVLYDETSCALTVKFFVAKTSFIMFPTGWMFGIKQTTCARILFNGVFINAYQAQFMAGHIWPLQRA